MGHLTLWGPVHSSGLNTPKHEPAQLSILPLAGREMTTSQKCGNALRLGSKGGKWLIPLVDKPVGVR